MKIYVYRCRTCGHIREELTHDNIRPCVCGGLSKRDYSTVNLRSLTAFHPHFNAAVGKFVRTESEFKSALSRCSDTNSLLTGADHKYESVDLMDREPTNKDMDIMDTKARILRDRGLTEKKVATFQ